MRQVFCIPCRKEMTVIFLSQDFSWVVCMNTAAACLRKWCLERRSGITAICRLISTGGLICCSAFSGCACHCVVKALYPAVSRVIEKIPPVAGKVLTYILVFAMALDMLISSVALMRYVDRKQQTGADRQWSSFWTTPIRTVLLSGYIRI